MWGYDDKNVEMLIQMQKLGNGIVGSFSSNPDEVPNNLSFVCVDPLPPPPPTPMYLDLRWKQWQLVWLAWRVCTSSMGTARLLAGWQLWRDQLASTWSVRLLTKGFFGQIDNYGAWLCIWYVWFTCGGGHSEATPTQPRPWPNQLRISLLWGHKNVGLWQKVFRSCRSQQAGIALSVFGICTIWGRSMSILESQNCS